MDTEATDPTGFHVILTDRCWAEHIIIGHPEMRPHREDVLETITHPNAIFKGKRDPRTRIYAKMYHFTDQGQWLDLLVFVGEDHGYVKTAYFAAMAFRMLGAQLWPTT